MDRGFTVEGLTVTYMPRNVGVGNVDTIQQRARFFGYKRSYLGFCRVFLDEVTIDAYNSIIEHEQDVRSRLQEFDINNKDLNEWDREAVLDRILNLTRTNILYDDVDRDRFGNSWMRIKAPHDTYNLIQSNRESLFKFLQSNESVFVEDVGHSDRTSEQKHLRGTISMEECVDNFLKKLKFTRESDSSIYSSLRGVLNNYLSSHPEEQCTVYLMGANSLVDWNARIRRLNNNDEIQQLFQGRNPRVGEVIYPGDFEIKENNQLTIQIHLLDLRDTEFDNVPTLAIWIPERIGVDIIRQA